MSEINPNIPPIVRSNRKKAGQPRNEAPKRKKPNKTRDSSAGYGGLKRLEYVGAYFATGMTTGVLLICMMMAGLSKQGEINALSGILVFASMGIYIYLTILRLNNAGYSGWWILGSIIPVLNLYVGLICIAGPEGYADHKTLDTPGKIITGLFLAIVVLSLVSVVLGQ